MIAPGRVFCPGFVKPGVFSPKLSLKQVRLMSQSNSMCGRMEASKKMIFQGTAIKLVYFGVTWKSRIRNCKTGLNSSNCSESNGGH